MNEQEQDFLNKVTAVVNERIGILELRLTELTKVYRPNGIITPTEDGKHYYTPLNDIANLVKREPKPPLNIIENSKSLSNIRCRGCGSTTHKLGLLGLFGERVCDNNECINSNPKFL